MAPYWWIRTYAFVKIYSIYITKGVSPYAKGKKINQNVRGTQGRVHTMTNEGHSYSEGSAGEGVNPSNLEKQLLIKNQKNCLETLHSSKFVSHGCGLAILKFHCTNEKIFIMKATFP